MNEAIATAPEAAPVESVEQVDVPNPISTENLAPEPEAEVKEPVKEEKAQEDKPKTTRDALKAAADKLESDEKAEKAEKDEKAVETKAKEDEKAKAEEKKDDKAEEPAKADNDSANKAEQDKPADKSEAKDNDAPSRFSSDAKAEWTKTPDPVKAEVSRAVRELESGLKEYQQRFETLKPFDDMAKQNNTTVEKALEAYTSIDGMLERDIVKGLETICQRRGVSLSDVAAHVLGQDPDKTRTESDTRIRDLANENNALKSELQEFRAEVERQQYTSIEQEVTKFKNEPGHERFEELEPMMARLISSGLAADIPEAYGMASTFKPSATPPLALVPAEPVPAAPAKNPEAQTLKGSQSITGAPSAGSDPVASKPSSSIKEALRKATQQATG